MNTFKFQSLVNQSSSTPAFFESGYLCLFDYGNKRLACFLVNIFLIGLSFNLMGQNCDYLPGDITLNSSPAIKTDFYTTAYFIIDKQQNSIVQINTEASFSSINKGFYEAYAVTYKTREGISNLEVGATFQSINANCLNFSVPYAFSVCSPPILQNLEENSLEICADNTTTINLTDAIIFEDLDGLLDTFSISLTIIESPDSSNDSLDVDLSPFQGLSKSFNNGQLQIDNLRSPMQVQAILRNIYFYSSSQIKGNRKIKFQVSDGINLSNTPNREIVVSPLPKTPVQIFRKQNE